MSEKQLLGNTRAINVRALYISEFLDMKTIELSNKLGEQPYLISAGTSGYAALFKYGVVVLFNLNPVEEAAFLGHLKNILLQPFDSPEIEECEIAVYEDRREGIENGLVVINDSTVTKLQIVASILSKSVVLARYEKTVATVMDRIEPMAAQLEKGRIGSSSSALIKQMGAILAIQHKMVGRVEVTEKPEFLWEHSEHEKLYTRLEYEYEIKERHYALERKFKLISETLEILVDLLKHKSSMRVEWYIVILIVIEILFSFYQQFWR